MGLLTLKTDLKSLKYGDEKPLIVKEIGKAPKSNLLSRELIHRKDDILRITELMSTKPGLNFIAHQGILGELNNKARVGSKERLAEIHENSYKNNSGIKESVVSTAKVIGSILSQVGATGTGQHFVRGFKIPTYVKDPYALFPRISDENTSINPDLIRETPIRAPKEIRDIGKLITTDTFSKPKRLLDYRDIVKPRSTSRGKDINTDYTTQDVQIRLKLGDQGDNNKNLTDYTKSQKIDELQKLPPLEHSTLYDVMVGGKVANTNVPLDIIPFEINVYSPNNIEGTFLYFRAHLGNIEDSYDGAWNKTRYIGRAEEFLNYTGFSRGFSFSLEIPAYSRAELIPLYEKLNRLVGATAPTYAKEGGTFMQGTLANITLGDYIKNLDGVIEKVSISWDKEVPWELNLENSSTIPIVPHMLSVSITFTPIHRFNVRSDTDLNRESFIATGQWYTK